MKPPEENTILFTPFWPLCLLALSLAGFLSWQVVTAAQQYIGLLRISDQQALVAAQAAQAENKLQAMMMDLLTLSKSDADARAIVGKYNIKFNPAQPAALPAQAVLPEPKPKKGAGTPPKPPAETPAAGEATDN